MRPTIMAKIKPQALLQQSKKKKGPSRVSYVTIAIYGLIVVVMAFFLFTSYRQWTRRLSSFIHYLLRYIFMSFLYLCLYWIPNCYFRDLYMFKLNIEKKIDITKLSWCKMLLGFLQAFILRIALTSFLGLDWFQCF